VPAGMPDPRGICTDQGASSCGTNGKCDGAGQCQSYAPGTVCSAASCPIGSSVLAHQGACSATGTCDALSSTCVPYLCGPSNACGFSCMSDADCAPPAHCNIAAGTCS
jgi:hypothetical protein